MQTLHLHAADPADIAHAARLLQQGRLVAFATETVYGLGANALNDDAVAAIFHAKQRPAWDPLIVHLAATAQLPTITAVPAGLASRISHLASHFWPGPLTLLLPRTAAVPAAVTAGRELVGVRVPAHPAAHALLAAAGVPVAAPSANTFGHTSPTTAQHVLDDLAGRIDAVLDAGPCPIGLESTVLDPTQTPMVLYRPGAITAAELTAATGIAVHIHQPAPTVAEPAALPSPGVGLRHYAPRARLVLIDPNPADLQHSLIAASVSYLSPQTMLGLMLPHGWAAPPGVTIFPWGDWHAPESLAHNLFDGLRALDAQSVTTILCPLPPPHPTGLTPALRDRLQKAARPT